MILQIKYVFYAIGAVGYATIIGEIIYRKHLVHHKHLVRKYKKHIGEERGQTKREINSHLLIKSEVNKYIEKCMYEGYTDEKIKKALLHVGWDEQVLNNLLNNNNILK